MKICTISGSTRPGSSNSKLLDSFPAMFPEQNIYRYTGLDKLPLFKPESDQHPWPEEVLHWRKVLAESDSLIICTPEYLHNLPALIKNALEWVTTSGELYQKRVLAITFTPHPPRGEKAMQSLRWSLQALDVRIVGELDLYQNEVSFDGENNILEQNVQELLQESIVALTI